MVNALIKIGALLVVAYVGIMAAIPSGMTSLIVTVGALIAIGVVGKGAILNE